MARFIPASILSSYSAIAALNQNFSDIEDLFDRCLFRDGTAPNSLLADLDANHFKLVNVKDGTAGTDAINYSQYAELLNNLAVLQTLLSTTLPIGADLLDGVFYPEAYGAVGNGVANDTVAFQTMSAAISALGGGTVFLHPGAVYSVGIQTLVNDGNWMFLGQDIFYIHGCPRDVVIKGNGAKFKYADNLKFGTFDSAGTPTSHALPYSGGDKSTPVTAVSNGILSLVGNSGSIDVDNIEFDGNVSNFVVGGDYGDTGKQLPGDLLFMSGNTGRVKVTNVYGHHSPRDGLQGNCVGSNNLGNDVPRYPHEYVNCTFDLNCRNNVSWLGGRGAVFRNLASTNAGRTSLGLPFASAPASCFDLETELGSSREMAFEDCLFSNAAGASFVTDHQNVENLFFKRCRFDSVDNWAFWVAEIPGVVFEDCFFFGSTIYNDPLDLTRAAKFIRCRWTDKDGDSLSGNNFSFTEALFTGAGGGLHGHNAYFKDCSWDTYHKAPFAGTGSIHQDSQFAAAPGIGIGYFADNIFKGHCNFDSTFAVSTVLDSPGLKIVGKITQNGTTQLFSGSAVYDPASLTNGSGATTTVTATGAKLGQKAEATFSLDLQGIRLFAWVSAVGVVSVRFENSTGGTINLGSGTILVRVYDLDVA